MCVFIQFLYFESEYAKCVLLTLKHIPDALPHRNKECFIFATIASKPLYSPTNSNELMYQSELKICIVQIAATKQPVELLHARNVIKLIK